ncbi:MAG: anthranilate phosphoribosyltransferase [Verrucomicrobia bacterium]|nr:anthranilate phosphoribosyltransferase [Verrucomicrobiota bacterium]
MAVLSSLTPQLLARRELTAGEMTLAAADLAAPEVPDAEKEAFLVALAAKGETAGEIAALAAAFRARAIDPQVEAWAGQAIDVVGTGGDHAGGFNISSLVTLVLASAGVVVMKHGNRGVTSRCGSADLLAGLGVNLEAPPEQVRRSLTELGYAFFFAPAWHPAFKAIGPTRKALAARGQRTVFNVLGPLINPGRPAHTLLGVATAGLVDKMALALDALGIGAGLVVHGVITAERGIDELTSATVNRVRGVGRRRGLDEEWRPEQFGLRPAACSDLLGGDLAENLALTDAILAGRAPAGLIDTIAFNSAAGLWLTGKAASVRDGIGTARELLLGGAVARKIAATKEFYRK